MANSVLAGVRPVEVFRGGVPATSRGYKARRNPNSSAEDGGPIRPLAPPSYVYPHRPRWRLWLMSWCCGLLALVAPMAYGQSAGDRAPRSAYRQVIEEAVAEFQRANWNEAIVLFRRAHKLRPSPKTHRGLGQSYFEARDYVNAIPHLRAALRSPQSFSAEQQKSLSRFLERSLSFVGAVKIELTPADATLIVDGVEIENNAEPQWLNPGVHTLLVHAPGHKPLQQPISIEGGTERTLRITLLAEVRDTLAASDKLPPSLDPSTGSVDPGDVSPPQRGTADGTDHGPLDSVVLAERTDSNTQTILATTGWVTAGLAVSAVAASLVMWRLREGGPVVEWYELDCNKDDSDSQCSKLANEADGLMLATTVAGIAGGALSAGAITLLALSLVMESDDAPTETDRQGALHCRPGLGHVQCALHF